MAQNIYEIGAPATEIKRLENFEWPSLVSKSIIESICAGTKINSLLDAGCGPGTQVAAICQKLGIAYTGFDNGKVTPASNSYIVDILKSSLNRDGLPGVAVYADVLTVGLDSFNGRNPDPRNDSLPDIAHMRFVLMHLMSCDWDTAIINMVKLAQKRVVLMEYDWRSVSSKTHPTLTRETVELFEKFAALVNLDLYAGHKLGEKADYYGYPSTYNIYSRAEGRFEVELLSKIPGAAEMARMLGHRGIADELEDKLAQFKSFGGATTLTPAEIHSVVIDTSVPRKPLI